MKSKLLSIFTIIVLFLNGKNEIEIMPRFDFDDIKIIYSIGDDESYFNLFTMNVNRENKQTHTKGDNYMIHARYRSVPI